MVAAFNTVCCSYSTAWKEIHNVCMAKYGREGDLGETEKKNQGSETEKERGVNEERERVQVC